MIHPLYDSQAYGLTVLGDVCTRAGTPAFVYTSTVHFISVCLTSCAHALVLVRVCDCD